MMPSCRDGYFTVEIDFGGVFDGTALWLEVGVRPGASTGGYQQLLPRQPLTAAPYALYASHVSWSGVSGMPAGFADNVDNNTTYAAGNQLSLAGTTFNVSEGAGSGLDADLLDRQHGSYYRNAANINAGTLSNARFSAYSDLSAEGYLNNTSSTDLLTRSQADGRYWNASNINSGTLSTARFDAYSDLSASGRLDNNSSSDLLTHSQADGRYQNVLETKTEYLSLPAAAFQPFLDGKDYQVDNSFRLHSGTGRFVAPVQLPHNAVVTSIKYYFMDNHPSSDTSISMYLVDNDGDSFTMGSCSSVAIAGTSCQDTSISYANINNLSYSYYVNAYLGSTYTTIRGYRVLITYTAER